MKRVLFLLSVVLIFSACKHKGTFSVSGVIKGRTEKHIYLNRLDVNTPVLIDSSKIGSNGKFSFRIKATEGDFYQLGFSTADFITLLAEPGEKIELSFEGKNLFENYHIKGSSGSEKLQMLDLTLNETKRKLDSLRTVYNKGTSRSDNRDSA